MDIDSRHHQFDATGTKLPVVPRERDSALRWHQVTPSVMATPVYGLSSCCSHLVVSEAVPVEVDCHHNMGYGWLYTQRGFAHPLFPVLHVRLSPTALQCLSPFLGLDVLKEVTPKDEVQVFGVNTMPKTISRASERKTYRDAIKLSVQ